MEQSLDSSSNSIHAFPLASLLKLYITAQSGKHSLYIEHFRGMKLLISFLAPIDCSSYPVSTYQWFESNYELEQLAIHIGCHTSQVIAALREIYYEQHPNR